MNETNRTGDVGCLLLLIVMGISAFIPVVGAGIYLIGCATKHNNATLTAGFISGICIIVWLLALA